MTARRAATMIELCIVVTIIAMVAAMLFPVLSSAKRSAKVADTIGSAHQLWIALTLYRSDWNGEGTFGTGSQMGLPIFGKQLLDAVPRDLWMKTCDPKKEGFSYWPDEDTGPGSWLESVTIAGENVPLVSTDTCTESPWDVSNQFHPKLGIASTLSGTVLKKRRAGNIHRISWWIN